jgi:hypothetical protein
MNIGRQQQRKLTDDINAAAHQIVHQYTAMLQLRRLDFPGRRHTTHKTTHHGESP